MRFLRALGYSVEEALVELWRNRLVNLVSIGTIAVSLFIFGVFASVTMSLNEVVAGWATRVQLTLYLEDGVSAEERARIDDTLKESAEVESFEFVSKEDAVTRFRSYFPELDALPDLLGGNPLPASYEVQVASEHRGPERVHGLAKRLGALAGVSDVDYDLLWIERLNSILDLVRVVGVAVGSALIMASVFTIFNVIKLTVYGRQEEIGIMRLVGATHAYIRGPFLVEGILQGGLGGAVALILLYVSHYYVLREALISFDLLSDATVLQFVPPVAWVGIVFGGMIVGLVGSALSVRKFLGTPA